MGSASARRDWGGSGGAWRVGSACGEVRGDLAALRAGAARPAAGGAAAGRRSGRGRGSGAGGLRRLAAPVGFVVGLLDGGRIPARLRGQRRPVGSPSLGGRAPASELARTGERTGRGRSRVARRGAPCRGLGGAAVTRRQQQVIVLRYWSDLSEAQIANTLGISPGTVKSSASRALAAIAQQLGDNHVQ